MKRDRPELLIGDYQGIAKRCALAFDYAHEEVPDFRRAPIREACTKYDLDGVELDFMRTFIFFKLGAERPEVVRMSEFMAQVRALLDEIGRFSWHALGVDIRGRSHILRVNYRTSHQIRLQADRLLPPETSDVDGNTDRRAGIVSVFNGAEPLTQTRRMTRKQAQ